ncbi:hypothetical protein GBA52_001474 [Prunus armeniaca]|nr:hypothetical protein GBA52_001474 [Prunus armeniaca]
MAVVLLATLFSLLLATQFNVGACAGSKNIFILAGQSNMAGRGGVSGGKWDGNVPPECQPRSSIVRLSAQLGWEQAHEPLHADIDVGKTCGVGPGMAFANEVLRVRGSRFGVLGLVPCAVGGTRIGEWARGTRLYNELVRRATESVRDGGVIRAVLWYQGESDTVNRVDAEGYKGNFERLVMDLRCDLKNPKLPVIQVALASGEGQFVDVVRKGQLDVKLGNVKYVDAKGLRLKEDHLHLTTISEKVNVGRRIKVPYYIAGVRLPLAQRYTKSCGELATVTNSHACTVIDDSDAWTQNGQLTGHVSAPGSLEVDELKLYVTEEKKEQGGVEIKVVDTVDYRSPAGEDKKPTKEEVEVVHETKDGANSGTGGGSVLASAAAAVSNAFQSAKDAVSGSAKDQKTTK